MYLYVYDECNKVEVLSKGKHIYSWIMAAVLHSYKHVVHVVHVVN